MKDKEAFGARLKRLRLSVGLSTIAVAEKLGVSPSTYREWEYGRAIRGEPYEKLSNILGVSLYELLVGESFRPSEALKLVSDIENALLKLRIEILKKI